MYSSIKVLKFEGFEGLKKDEEPVSIIDMILLHSLIKLFKIIDVQNFNGQNVGVELADQEAPAT